jgi:arginine decarboxylase
MSNWTHLDAESLYNVPKWGSGYFGVNPAGNVVVYPEGRSEGKEIDLHELIGQIRRRGVEAPILLRFNGILRARVRELFGAFDNARNEYGYTAPYQCVFPIKVNQQRLLVDVLFQEGAKHGMGIEVGSKPELLAVMSSYAEKDRLIICNGYKDREYVELALLTSRMGTKPILVIEKFSELATILETSRAMGIRPTIGVRSKLSGKGAGRWKDSGGSRSKFGLTTRQIVQVVEELRENDMLDCLKLLHFHLGSQITRIRSIKNAISEAARTFTGIVAMGAELAYLDVGGGLGIDYDGSSSDFESSVNYSVQEYANDVVYHIREVCAEAGVPQPTILSESGRALTAHHAVLVTEVMGVTNPTVGQPPKAGPDEADTVRKISEVCEAVTAKNFQECYHDAQELRDEGMQLFGVGLLTLEERSRVEELFWRTCEKIQRITRNLEYVPDDMEGLERDLADTYFMNFSVFQSLPDSWAIRQLFPVLPLHRLTEEPTRRAVLADITCDSDGKIDRFIDLRDVKPTLELHSPREGERYYLGFFLVGAYQEILGDMHNLFGDTHVFHVEANGDGRAHLSHFVEGNNVEEVLSYVEYPRADLLATLRQRVEQAIDEDRMTLEESGAILKRFEAGLASYTYLITPDRVEQAARGEAAPR